MLYISFQRCRNVEIDTDREKPNLEKAKWMTYCNIICILFMKEFFVVDKYQIKG